MFWPPPRHCSAMPEAAGIDGDSPGPGRIFCIGRNYAEHARELDNPLPAEPVVFMKPGACLCPPEGEIAFPRHGDSLHQEVEIVIRIGKGGRDIPAAEAAAHVDGVTVGFDLTLRDVQTRLKDRGLPWEKAKAFENAAPIGEFVAAGGLDLGAIEFGCTVAGQQRQKGNTRDMLFSIPRLVEYLSSIWALAPGDLVYTGTPAGVGPVGPGDELVAEAAGIGRFRWTIAPRTAGADSTAPRSSAPT